jgi:integrase
MRSLATNIAQAEASIALLRAMGRVYVDEVTPADLDQFRDICIDAGYTPATIKRRLACLSVLGVDVARVSVPASPSHKWYLKAEEEIRLPQCPDLAPLALSFIQWTCATGLRVEESLRLRWSDISLGSGAMLRVPGTKTAGAERTIALSDEAVAILQDIAPAADGTPQVFRFDYSWLRGEWQKARTFLGLTNVPMATLKALRRSFARRAHLKGMPSDVLRQYLGHERLSTTEGYLRLVGGYAVEEQRRWL